MSDKKITVKRRPRVEVKVESHDMEFYAWRDGVPSSGVQLTLTRRGIEVSGWYDTFVGIEGWYMSWEEFDALRAKL